MLKPQRRPIRKARRGQLLVGSHRVAVALPLCRHQIAAAFPALVHNIPLKLRYRTVIKLLHNTAKADVDLKDSYGHLRLVVGHREQCNCKW